VLHAMDISKNEKARFLRSITCWNNVRVSAGNGFVRGECAMRGDTGPTTAWQGEAGLERRAQFRYGVQALANFEWMDEGVLRKGRGMTRDISPTGMFINSDVKPPVKADLLVDVRFEGVLPMAKKLKMGARGLVIRVEPGTGGGSVEGFAILNRSYELRDGANSVDD
jgi:hypothetical protein